MKQTTYKKEVHVSDVRAFKTCRRQWNWSSPLGENLEPDKPYAPFFLGRIVHTALELYYRSNGRMTIYEATDVAAQTERRKMETAGTLWEQEEEMLSENLELAFGMMQHYELWVKSKGQETNIWGDANLEFLDMETTFDVPFFTANGAPSNKVSLGGRFDGIVRRRDDGSFWLFETKTTRSIQELQKTLPFDEQAGAYIYAAQVLLGERVAGVLYNILRKKVPSIPKVLRDGTLSRNKSIDTTVDVYWNEVVHHHDGWTKENQIAQYQGVLSHLHTKGNTFFTRTPVRRTPNEIDELAKNLWHVALEMTRPSTWLYPAPNWTNCTFCRFRGPCMQVNAGADPEFVLEHEYRQRSDRELRPYLLYGFHFVPIASDKIDVWYYGDLIVEGASYMAQALGMAGAWIINQEEAKNGYVGPNAGELLAGAKEIGLWQDE